MRNEMKKHKESVRENEFKILNEEGGGQNLAIN